MTAAAFAGMPVTAVIARSSLNIKLKAHSRLPSLVQSAFVFGSLALYSDVISAVPLSALAGVLISSGAGMLQPAELKTSLAEDKYNLGPPPLEADTRLHAFTPALEGTRSQR